MIYKGKLEINKKGYGFVRCSSLAGSDIFVPGKWLGDAMDGDTVTVRISRIRKGKLKTGKITDVLERKTRLYTGILVKKKKRFYIISPDGRYSKDFYVVRDLTKAALPGDLVCGEIKYYGTSGECFRGNIIKTLGDPREYRNSVYETLLDLGIDPDFSKRTLKEAGRIPSALSGDEYDRRMDLRDILTFTIDGSDAKDLDDALSYEKTKSGYRIGVHIADVSQYVKCHSIIDSEAMRRGTSVYFPGLCVPMLPRELSNGICSLNEGEDRLALSVIFDIDKDFKVKGSVFSKTVINSDKRMDYDSVNKILEDNTVPCGYEKFTEALGVIGKVSDELYRQKEKRGCIAFDIPEADISVDEMGKVTAVGIRKRNLATRLIEDLMVLANETVATEFFKRGLPMIYRVHDKPDRQDIDNAFSLFARCGFNVKRSRGSVTPADICRALSMLGGTSEEYLLNRVLLRSMARAEYSSENSGHFALASSAYCHFTSPIRRYPDLFVHRLLKKYILEDEEYADIAFTGPELKTIAFESSENERKAQEAERRIEKIKKAEYISSYTGHIFNGIISGVTKWGVYIELENTVEGLAGISTLTDDSYRYNEKMCRLEGKRTGRTLTLGDKVTVRITGADKRSGNVDMIIEEYSRTED